MGENLDVGAKAADARRADEDHLHGPTGQARFAVEDDRVILAAVGVSLDIDIEHTEAALRRIADLFCQQDAAGAGAEDRLGADKVVEDRIEAGALEVLEEGRGLSARKDKGVERCEFIGFADEVRGGAKLRKAFRMNVERALERENTNSGAVLTHLFRVAAR